MYTPTKLQLGRGIYKTNIFTEKYTFFKCRMTGKKVPDNVTLT